MSRYVWDTPSTATNCAVGSGGAGGSAAPRRGDASARRHRVQPKVLRRVRYIAGSPLLIGLLLPVLLVSDCRVAPWTATPEPRVQRHVPRRGASLMPPGLELARGRGRRAGARRRGARGRVLGATHGRRGGVLQEGPCGLRPPYASGPAPPARGWCRPGPGKAWGVR